MQEIKTLMYRRVVDFLGRNGEFAQSGVELYLQNVESDKGGRERTLWIEPITSQGKNGRARLKVPFEDLPALRDLLDEIIALEESENPEPECKCTFAYGSGDELCHFGGYCSDKAEGVRECDARKDVKVKR